MVVDDEHLRAHARMLAGPFAIRIVASPNGRARSLVAVRSQVWCQPRFPTPSPFLVSSCLCPSTKEATCDLLRKPRRLLAAAVIGGLALAQQARPILGRRLDETYE